jgi:uncharacterized protein YcaQ
MDSINVLDRAHYLTLWSRFGPYDRKRLYRLVYRRRLLFEYWAHAACLVSTTTLPWWRRAMADYEVRHSGWSTWLRRNAKVLALVEKTIRSNGPMAAGDFDRVRRAGGRGGWWSWRPVQHAVHYLWMTGALTVHSRRHFQKRFDLLDRAIPDATTIAPVSSEAFRRWHVERSLHAMGAATDVDLAGYLTFPRLGTVARKPTLASMLADGELTAIEVEGLRGRWLVLTRDVPALARAARRYPASRGTTLLSPFDSLLWYRDRVARLFGFEYRIEVYTPGPQRRHGYYTLPILHDGQLVGRVDAKVHRTERRLEARNVQFEPWALDRNAPRRDRGALHRRVEEEEALAGLGEALASLSSFVGATKITLVQVSPRRLRAPLARVLRSATPLERGDRAAGRAGRRGRLVSHAPPEVAIC